MRLRGAEGLLAKARLRGVVVVNGEVAKDSLGRYVVVALQTG